MRFFYIKRTGRAKHGEVPYAVCAYCMEKLFQNMYLETRLRQQLYLTLAKQIIDNLFKIILLIMMTQSNTNKCFIILKPRTDFIQKIDSSGMRQDSSSIYKKGELRPSDHKETTHTDGKIVKACITTIELLVCDYCGSMFKKFRIDVW